MFLWIITIIFALILVKKSLAFDEERYALIRSNGSTEVLTSDKFAFTNGATQLQIYNLGSNDTGATLVTTLRKLKPKYILVDYPKYLKVFSRPPDVMHYAERLVTYSINNN